MKENIQYNIDILRKYKLIELRKIASIFKIKQHYKMDKNCIIDAILLKQNSISDTSSCSGESDTEIIKQIQQEIIKEEKFVVYILENTETTENTEEETTETEEEKEETKEEEETIKKLPNKNITYKNRYSDLEAYEKEYVEGIQDIQVLEDIIRAIKNSPKYINCIASKSKECSLLNENKQKYETDLKTLKEQEKTCIYTSDESNKSNKPPKKKDGVCNKSDDSDDSTKTRKHVYTKSETEQLLTPEEIDELSKIPTTISGKYRRERLNGNKRQRKFRENKIK